MDTKKITNSLVTVGGTAVGAMASRVIADKVPVKNAKMKHGALAVLGMVGASFLNSKKSAEAFIQDVAIGMSATQIGYLIKELAGDKAKGVMATALGNPDLNYEDIAFLSSYDDYIEDYNDYDFIPENTDFTDYEIEEPVKSIEFR